MFTADQPLRKYYFGHCHSPDAFRKHTSRKLGALGEDIRMKNSAGNDVIVVYSTFCEPG
jgi:hypothetical protein